MGDSILEGKIVFYAEQNHDTVLGLYHRIRLVMMEHQYQRCEPYLGPGSWFSGLSFSYRLPDSDGDRDGFHRCGAEVMFDRIRAILRSVIGGDDGYDWQILGGLEW